MAYPGYISIGEDDPFAGLSSTEIVNSARAFAYAQGSASVDWLHECDLCPEAALVVPGGPDFVSPVADPAPWYDADNPDSWGFLGVVGVELTGVDSSTRQSTVTMALTGGGVIGPTYLGPREMVVRALAIAEDECSLSFGLTWLRGQYQSVIDPCAGDPMTFFDCCPCVCEDDTPGGPCWAEDYFELRVEPVCEETTWVETYGQLRVGMAESEQFPDWPAQYSQLRDGMDTAACWPVDYLELRRGPSCTAVVTCWWPDTYAQLKVGPGVDEGECWCAWPVNYRRLRTGPAGWSCCIDVCVYPYLRQFQHSRVTAGPVVLRRPAMSCGALAEIEFVIVAASPEVEAMPFRAVSGVASGAEVVPVTVGEEPPRPDPFARPGALVTLEVAEPVTTEWLRDTFVFGADPFKALRNGYTPTITLATRAATGEVRLAIWHGEERVADWRIPFLPADTTMTITGPTATVDHDDNTRQLPAFVRTWDDRWPRAVRLGIGGDYTLTVDQEPDRPVDLVVAVSMTAIGARCPRASSPAGCTAPSLWPAVG